GSRLNAARAVSRLSDSMMTIEPTLSPLSLRKGPASNRLSPRLSRNLRWSGRTRSRSSTALGRSSATRAKSILVLPFEGARHEPRNDAVDRDGARQQLVDRVDERRLDPGALRERLRHRRGKDAFGKTAGLKRLAAERHAVLVVARLRRGAAQREVAKTGEAGQRLGAAAQRRHDTAQLREGASDQAGAGRGAELGPLDRTGSQRIGVLERPAELDARDVGGGIEPEARAGERRGDGLGRGDVVAGEGHGGGPAGRDINRETRTGQDVGHGIWGELAQDLALALEAVVLEPFGGEHDGLAEIAEQTQDRARRLRRHRKDHEIGAAVAAGGGDVVR